MHGWIPHTTVEAQVGFIEDAGHVRLKDQLVCMVLISIELEGSGVERENFIE